MCTRAAVRTNVLIGEFKKAKLGDFGFSSGLPHVSVGSTLKGIFSQKSLLERYLIGVMYNVV